MKIKFLFLSLVLLTSIEAKPQVLTIDEMIEISLTHSPDIDIGRFDFKAAQERIKFAEGSYLPRLDVKVSSGKQYAKLRHQSGGNIDTLKGSLGASQLLYDFGKTAGRVMGSTQEALALEAQMQQIISDKIFLVKQSYYDILKTKSIMDVQVKNVTLQKQQLKRAQKYLEAGIKTIIDVSDAQVQVEQAQLDLKNAQYDLELKRAVLEEILGYVPYNGNYVVYSQKLNMQDISKTLPRVKTSLQQLELYAYKHRYVLSASEYYVRGAESNVNVSSSEYYPTLSLNGNYEAQHVDSSALMITPERQGEISVNMSWNIFSGYETDASVQEAKIGVLKAASHVQSITLAIKRDVLESHISVRKSRDNVVLSESISKASLKKFEQAEKRYANELSDYVELQDAQQGYITSLSEVVKAYYDYFIAMAKLDHAIGK